MSRKPVEGIEAHGDDGEAPGVKAWNRYLQHQDDLAAEQAAASEHAAQDAAVVEQARIVRSQNVRQDPQAPKGPLSSAAAAAGAAAGNAMRGALRETPEQRRMDVFAAMQADAFARLEVAQHADGVVGAQREVEHSDPAAIAADRALTEARHDERNAVDPTEEAARRPDALRPKAGFVARPAKGDKPSPDDRGKRDR